MFNMLLDRLPSEYEGYLIRTDFRIGIQISLCFKDIDLSDEEKFFTALYLLYGNGIPDDLDLAMEGLQWFMSCDKPKSKNSASDDKEVFYFDFDSERLYSSFMVSYGIDLTTEKLHWFKFISLLGSITKDCALSKAIEVRTYDMKDLKGKARSDMMKLKSDLTPEVEYSSEEKEKMAEFDALFDESGDVNG